MNTGLITRFRNIILTLLTVTATVAGSYSAKASHFRGSTVSWAKHPTLSNTIIINSESSIRKSSGNYSGAIGTMVSNGTLNLNPLSVAGLSIRVTYSSNGTTNTTTTATVFSHTGMKIVDNSIEDYITVEMGRIENGVWTPGILVEYISFVPHHIGFQQVCCRVNTLNANYEEQNYGAYVDLISVNSAPKSGSPAVLQVPLSQIMNGGTWTYQLSASDADNDIIRYRVGTTDFGGQVNFEFGNSFNGSEAKPAGLTMTQNGLITWTPGVNYSGGTMAVLGYVIEDFSQFSNTRKSAASYDILLNIVDDVTTPNLPPNITSAPTTTQYSPFIAGVGSTYNYTIVASDVYSLSTNRLPAQNGYPTITQITSVPNLTTNYTFSSPYEVTASIVFTPAAFQAGQTYAVQYTVDDGQLITNYILNIQVRNNPNPTIQSVQKIGSTCSQISFSGSDFTSVFSDPDNDPLQWIRLTNLPQTGSLLFKGNTVQNGDEILLSEVQFLSYYNSVPGDHTFSWEGKDDQGFWSQTSEPVVLLIEGVTTTPTNLANTNTTSPVVIDNGTLVNLASNATSLTIEISEGRTVGDILSTTIPNSVNAIVTYNNAYSNIDVTSPNSGTFSGQNSTVFQEFTPTITGFLQDLNIKLGGLTNNVATTVTIYEGGSLGTPSSGILRGTATAVVPASTTGLVQYTFSSPIPVTANTKYWFMLDGQSRNVYVHTTDVYPNNDANVGNNNSDLVFNATITETEKAELTITGIFTDVVVQQIFRATTFQSTGTSQSRKFRFTVGSQIQGCDPFTAYRVLNNALPTISSLIDQATCLTGTTAVQSVTISDVETPVSDLNLVVVSSSNTAVVPLNKVEFDFSGATPTVAVINSGVYGSSVVTIGVVDAGGGMSTESFTWSSTLTDGIATSSGATFNPSQTTPTVVDANVSVVSSSNISGALVSVDNFQTGDVLAIRSGYTLPAGLTSAFNSSTGVLTLSGTVSASNMQAALRNVVFSTTSLVETARNISFTLGTALPNPVNGHYYEYVSAPNTTWASAKSAAALRTFNGLGGYLATVTSSDENQFIYSKLSNDGWLGGSDDYQEINAAISTANFANQAAAEGRWHWVTGPDQDRYEFWNNGAITGVYSNWNSNEPNNSAGNESCLQMYFASPSSGKWNDLSSATNLQGYIVEYGGLATDVSSCFTSSSVKVFELNQTPTISGPSTSTICVGTALTVTENLTIGDGNDGTGALGLSLVSSSNTTLVPVANVSFGGSGANRTVTINVPNNASSGSSTLVIEVTDRYGKASRLNVLFTYAACAPTVTTGSVSSTLSTTSSVAGNVTNQGGSAVTDRGVVYGTTTAPTISGSKAQSGTGTGSFTANLTGLLPNTLYYARAYATNSQGTAYGSEVTFTTAPAVPNAITTDFDDANFGGPIICSGSSVTLTSSVAVGTLEWSTSCGGTLITPNAGGNSITVSPTTTTTYYVRTYNATTGLRSACQSVVVTVQASAPTITYSSSYYLYYSSEAITPNSVTVSGSGAQAYVASYAISPTLPAGLSFNTATGQITGTSTNGSPRATYTVTGTTPCGAVSTTIEIEVLECSGLNVNDFLLRGNATTLGSGAATEFRLTDALGAQFGAVWNQTRLDLTKDFDISSQVYLGNNDAGADGIAFVLQPLSTNQGSSGGGLGYAGINPSVAVEFDTYYNSEPTTNDHVAIMINGNTADHSAGSYDLGNIEDGQYRTARFKWEAATKTFRVFVGGTQILTKTNWDIVGTILNNNPYVYWGFTGATGGAVNVQKVKFDRYCLTLASNTLANVTTTSPIGSVTSTTAAISGEVVNDGGAAVTERGFVIGLATSPTTTPTTGGFKITDANTGVGTFSGSFNSLQPATLYYARSYAINSLGTAYGNEISFYTRPANITGVTSSNFNATHQSNVICYGASTTLTAAGVSGVVYWYTGSCSNGTQVGIGNTLTVSPTTTTTYFARNYNNNLFSDGCASITVVVRPQLVAPTISGAEIICWNSEATGLTGTQATGGSSAAANAGFGYQWQKSEDFGATWQNIVGQTNFASFMPGFLFQTTQYRLLATDLGSPVCTTNIASNVIQVTVRDPFTPSVVSTTNPNNTVCQAGSVSLTATPTTGGSGPPFLYQWQSSLDSANWVNVGPALQNTTAYTVPSVTTDTYYRLIAFDMGTPGCGSVFSTNAVRAIVQTAITEGAISGAQHICAGTAPTAAIASVTVGTGRGTISYRWEASTNNGQTWTTISGATGASYQPGVLQTTTDFRRFTVSTVNSVNCESLQPTSVVRITVDQLPVATIATAGTTSCVNTAVTVPGVTINHGTAVWTHNGQGAITGTLSAPVYTPVAADAGTTVTLTLTVTGTAICLNVPAVDTYVIVVDPLPVATAGGSATICENATHTVVGAASANGTILWTHNGAGTLAGATTLTPTYTAAAGDAGQAVTLTMTVSSNNTCTPATATATYTVNVDQLPAASAGGTQTICSLASATVSGASAARGSILWTHNGNGTIANATTLTPTYTAGAADAGTTVTLTMTVTSTNVCGPQTAVATYTVVVRPDFVPATFVNQKQDLCYNTGASQITATAATGGTGPYAYQWQVSTDSTTWTNISGATSLTYTPSGTFTSSRYYRILSTDLGTPTCGTTLAGAADVKLLVRAPLTPPVLANVTICQGTSTTLTPTLAMGGRNNFTYQWQQSANGTTGWTNVGTSSTTIAFTTPNLTGTTFYRVIARDENVTLNNLTYISCGSTFSQPIRVTVAASTTAGAISGNETTCVGAATAAIASVTAGTGSGTVTYRWEQSIDNGTTWTTVQGATAATYAPGSLTQTTMYRRITVSLQSGTTCESAPTSPVTKTVQQLAVFTAAGSNVTTNTDAGLPTAVVNYTVTATAVTPVTLTYAFTGATTATGSGTGSGSAFGIGTTTVTVTATTQCGTTTTTFTVEVVDNENPVITAGADMTLSNVPSPTVYTFTSGSLSSSIFSNSNQTYTYNFNDPLPNGAVISSIEVTFTNTVSIPSGFYSAKTIDLNGTTLGSAVSSGGSFTDVVTYNGPMTVYNYGGANSMRFDAWWNPYVLTGFTLKLNYTMPFEGCERTITVPNPTATDNAPGLVITYSTTGSTVSSGTAPLSETFAVGTSTITWTATDASGNTATDVQLVTITDDADPIISGTPANITINATPGLCTSPATWTAPTANDECGIQTFTGSAASGDLFPVGVTTVTYTATDIHGNVATSSFTVTVVDNQLPVISGTPANITVTSDANACGTTVTWTAATAADNCAISTFTPNIASGSFFAVGRTRVRYTAVDVNGNSDTSGFWVQVLDLNPILSNMPANISVLNDAGLCSAVVTWDAPSFTDNCSGTVLTSTHTPGQAFAVGTTTVTYTATDNNGNVTSASFTVTVNDTELPVWSNVPANITVAARATSCDAVVTWPALTIADNCTAQPTVTSTKASGDVFALGTTTVTFTGVDAAGNSASTSFTVTVVDQTAPVITVPANITESVDANGCTSSSVVVVVPAATDQCDQVTATGVRSDNLALTAPFPLGVTTITWTASDLAGNAATPVVQSITVVDTIAPYVATQLDSVVYVNENSCVYYWENWRADIITADNCGETATLTSARPQNLFLNKGVHVINFTLSDSHGNARVYNHRVRVADTISPKLTNMPANITAYAAANCQKIVTWVDPTPSDNCVNFVMTSSHNAGDVFGLGVTPVNFLVTDASGRTKTGGFTVTVLDTIKPVIPTQAATLALNAQGTATLGLAQVLTAAGITDNCGLDTAYLSKTAFTCAELGANTVAVTATDVNGNTRTKNVVVTVVDQTSPVVATKSATLYLNASGTATLSASSVNNGTTDNCGVASYSVSKSTFNCSNVGANTVTLSATDASGNVGTATATVTVLDTIKPVLTVANTTITAYVSGNQCARVVNIPGVTATDNCAATISMNPISGSVFSVGTTPVTVTATDASGNLVSTTINVVVLDTISPVIAGVPVSVTKTPVAGACSAVVTWASPAAFDNCSVSLTSSAVSGSTFTVGTHTVVWTAVDPSGNTTTASLTFTVADTEAPTLSNVPSTITLYSSTTQCNAIATWPSINAVDNCGSATVATSIASGSVFTVGTTNVNVTATDAAGNQVTSSFQVVVLDTISPVWNSVPQNILAGSCSSAVSFIAPGAVDNCGSVTVAQTSGLPSGSIFPIGVTTNTFVATDASGNTATVSFTVTVQGSGFVYTPAQTVFCFNDAAVDLMPAGGVANLSFAGSGVSGTMFTPRNAGLGNHVITYTFVDSLGCQSVQTFTVTVNASPTKPVIMRMTSTTLKVVDTYPMYQWRRNGVNIVGANQQTYSVTTSGIYDVIVTNGACSNISDPYGFGVTIGEDELDLNDLRVQPNPNNGQFTLIHSLPLDEVQSVQIVDMLGRVIYEAPLSDARITFDVRTIAQGQYLVVVRSATNVITKPIVIQH